jgi:Flp pilus assembly secretin CpaC
MTLAVAASLRAEPPAAQSITVEVTVIEVNRTKLRALGFDWDLVKNGGRSDVADLVTTQKQLDGFMQALQQYNMANVLCRPKLMTLSGRPASLAIGDHLRLDVVPIVLESGRIRVEHRLELAEPKLKSDGAVEVAAGQAIVAGQVRHEAKDPLGNSRETETLVFVRADTLVR